MSGSVRVELRSTCRNMMRGVEAPMTFADSTNASDFTRTTSARTTRKYCGMKTTVMDAAGSETFHVVPFADPDTARAALDAQQIYAVIDPAASALTLSTASGSSVAGIVEECIASKKSLALWLQDGVVDEQAAARAREAGLTVVMNRCIYRDYIQLIP